MASSTQFRLSGDQTATLRGSLLDEVSLLETATLTLDRSFKNSLLAPNPTAVLDEPETSGQASFVAAATVAVTFDVPRSSNSFQVWLTPDDQPVSDETPWITNKLTTGFTIEFSSAQTLSVDWRLTA